MRFETTNWSRVIRASRASGSSEAEVREALEALCVAYWQPIYFFLRRRGCSAEEAEDVAQGFFVEILETDFLQRADPKRGRFRSYLLASVTNYLSRQRTRDRALKRGGGLKREDFDFADAEERYQHELASEATPETLFQQRWALTLLERAMNKLELEAEEKRRPEVFQRLKVFLSAHDEADGYAAAARDLEMTVGAVKTGVYRLRRRYGTLLREEIAATVVNPSDVEDELRQVLTPLRPAS